MHAYQKRNWYSTLEYLAYIHQWYTNILGGSKNLGNNHPTWIKIGLKVKDLSELKSVLEWSALLTVMMHYLKIILKSNIAAIKWFWKSKHWFGIIGVTSYPKMYRLTISKICHLIYITHSTKFTNHFIKKKIVFH